MIIRISHRTTVAGYTGAPSLHAVESWPDDMPLPAIGDRIDWPSIDSTTPDGRVRGRVTGRTFSETGVLVFVEEARP